MHTLQCKRPKRKEGWCHPSFHIYKVLNFFTQFKPSRQTFFFNQKLYQLIITLQIFYPGRPKQVMTPAKTESKQRTAFSFRSDERAEKRKEVYCHVLWNIY